MNSRQLLQELVGLTKQNISAAEKFKNLSNEQLNFRHSPEKWSILECLGHLNQYSDYYLPKITSVINNSKNDFVEAFQPGILGNYFAESMVPKKNMKKMKSPKDKLPKSNNLDISVIHSFIENQRWTLTILENCTSKNLNKNKVPTSISNFISLRLGDALRFVIYHNLRHILQAEKTCKHLKKDA